MTDIIFQSVSGLQALPNLVVVFCVVILVSWTPIFAVVL